MHGHSAISHTHGQPQSAPAAHQSPVHTVSTRHHQTAPPMYNPGAFSSDRVSAATTGTYPLPTVYISQGHNSLPINSMDAPSWFHAGQQQVNGGMSQSPMMVDQSHSLLSPSPDGGSRYAGSPLGSKPFEEWEKAVLLGAQRDWARAGESTERPSTSYTGGDSMMSTNYRNSASPNVGLRPSVSPSTHRFYPPPQPGQNGSPQRMPLTYSHPASAMVSQNPISSAQGPSQKFNWLGMSHDHRRFIESNLYLLQSNVWLI